MYSLVSAYLCCTVSVCCCILYAPEGPRDVNDLDLDDLERMGQAFGATLLNSEGGSLDGVWCKRWTRVVCGLLCMCMITDVCFIFVKKNDIVT